MGDVPIDWISEVIISDSAKKHGAKKEDMIHAYETIYIKGDNRIGDYRTDPNATESRIDIGFDTHGRLLEKGWTLFSNDILIFWHVQYK